MSHYFYVLHKLDLFCLDESSEPQYLAVGCLSSCDVAIVLREDAQQEMGTIKVSSSLQLLYLGGGGIHRAYVLHLKVPGAVFLQIELRLFLRVILLRVISQWKLPSCDLKAGFL